MIELKYERLNTVKEGEVLCKLESMTEPLADVQFILSNLAHLQLWLLLFFSLSYDSVYWSHAPTSY